MLDSAKACAMKDKDSEFVYSLAKEYTDLYTAQGQFSEALRALRQSRRYMKRNDIPLHNMYKAHVYELMHREDSACYYYNLVSQSSNIFLASEAHYASLTCTSTSALPKRHSANMKMPLLSFITSIQPITIKPVPASITN